MAFVDPLGLFPSLGSIIGGIIGGAIGGLIGKEVASRPKPRPGSSSSSRPSGNSSSRPSGTSSRPSSNSNAGRAPANANNNPGTGLSAGSVVGNKIVDVLYDSASYLHFEGREARNSNLPSYRDIINDPDTLWRKLPPEESIYHQNGRGKPELKYVHPDGREVVFDGDTETIVTDINDYGTYNYVPLLDPNQKGKQGSWWRNAAYEIQVAGSYIGHGIFDVVPYIFGGSIRGEEDSTLFERIIG